MTIKTTTIEKIFQPRVVGGRREDVDSTFSGKRRGSGASRDGFNLFEQEGWSVYDSISINWLKSPFYHTETVRTHTGSLVSGDERWVPVGMIHSISVSYRYLLFNLIGTSIYFYFMKLLTIEKQTTLGAEVFNVQ